MKPKSAPKRDFFTVSVRFRGILDWCRYRDGLFVCRFHETHPCVLPCGCCACKSSILQICRIDSRDTFLCLAKGKYPKETPPEFRLDPAFLRKPSDGFRAAGQPTGCSNLLPTNLSLFARVFEGPSLLLRKRAASCRSPNEPVSRCSGRNDGRKPS